MSDKNVTSHIAVHRKTLRTPKSQDKSTECVGPSDPIDTTASSSYSSSCSAQVMQEASARMQADVKMLAAQRWTMMLQRFARSAYGPANMGTTLAKAVIDASDSNNATASPTTMSQS